MQQSLLALLALLVVSIYSFGITRDEIHKQNQAVTREIEEMASSIAIETLEIISERAFDQAVVDSLTSGEDADTTLFAYYTDESHFEPNTKDCAVFDGPDQCRTIEDFHLITPVIRQFIPDVDTSNAINFNVWAEVEYVDDGLNRVNGKALRKRVNVMVQDTWPKHPNMESFIVTPIEISRTFTYEY